MAFFRPYLTANTVPGAITPPARGSRQTLSNFETPQGECECRDSGEEAGEGIIANRTQHLLAGCGQPTTVTTIMLPNSSCMPLLSVSPVSGTLDDPVLPTELL